MDELNYGWNASIISSNSSSRLFEKFDKINIDQYNNCKAEFKELSAEEKCRYKNSDGYIENKYSIQLSSLNKDYALLMQEVLRQLETSRTIELLPIDFIMQEQAIFDMLSSFEDNHYIQDIYKQKKLLVRSGLNNDGAITLVDCMRQGRRLLEAAQSANVLAKPLIDFYAATAYAYALIIINSPLHKGIESLKGSHGHAYIHEEHVIEFGGKIPRGTFLDLLCAVPVSYIYCRNENDDVNINYSLIESIDLIQRSNIKISLLTLLSMVPELHNYYRKVDPEHKIVHRLRIDSSVAQKKIIFRFYIGDGNVRPNIENLKQAFGDCAIEEEAGTYKIVVPVDKLTNIMPCIYQDIRGDLYYIDGPIKGVVIPEICLHYLIISALCNIMRYSPNEWNKILTNKVSSSFSLLINRYLRLFEQKFPMIVVQYLSNYCPVLQLH